MRYDDQRFQSQELNSQVENCADASQPIEMQVEAEKKAHSNNIEELKRIPNVSFDLESLR